MGTSKPWEEIGPTKSDPELNERIRKQLELEARVSTDVFGRANAILDLRDSDVGNPRNRTYDSRAEKLMTLRLIQGTGYPIPNGYDLMSDNRLSSYLSEVITEVRSRRR